jgi:hypothetical protein
MREKLTLALIGLYRENLGDYDQLLEKIEKYQQYLESQDKHTDRSIPQARGLDPQRFEAEAIFEKELAAFADFRDQVFRRLRERASKVMKIQELISRETGIPFAISSLRPYLAGALYQELSLLAETAGSKLKQILQMDEKIISSLKMELEAVKLELHRIQGAQKTKNAYGSQGNREARFIDKTK